MEAVRKRVEHRKRVVGEAKKWAENLPHKATAIFIGSYARGDFNLWSDVDILLITDLARAPTKLSNHTNNAKRISKTNR